VQRAIEQQERLIQVTTELKKSLMKRLFTEGLHGEPQKMTEIGPMPESWKVVKFENFATLQRGKDLTKAKFTGGVVPVAGSNGIIGYHNVSNVKGPGVTVGRSGSVGKVVYYDRDFWAHNTCLYVKEFHGNYPMFTAYYLDFINLSRFKSGASVPTLDRNSFRTMPIAVPRIEEQVEISVILRKVEERNYNAEQITEALKSLFRTLLHQLMTAQIRVNDIEEIINEDRRSN
jgi:type I restriction enzyme S subunit